MFRAAARRQWTIEVNLRSIKHLLLIGLSLATANAATLQVCASGCAYSTAQSAANASSPGDTVELRSGQNLGALTLAGGFHDRTFKSSLVDTYPRQYRMTRANPALSTLTSITIGDSLLWLTGTVPTSILTNSPGGFPQAHGLSIGQPVVVGGSQFSAYACASINQVPYVDGACDSTRVGYINIRAQSGLANGSVIYLIGRSAPPPLVLNTPYYIINFTAGSSYPVNADKFQLSATSGGSTITIPAFNPSGQDFIICEAPSPELIGTTMYVASTPTSSTLTLSTTPGGSAVTFTQMPFNYNGSALSSGFRAATVNPNYNLKFDGLEVAPTSDTNVYYVVYVVGGMLNAAGEHHNIQFLRGWVHGADDQQDFPNVGINISARDIEVGWSVVEIRKAYAKGLLDGVQLASNYGVHYSVVYDVIHRRIWKHI